MMFYGNGKLILLRRYFVEVKINKDIREYTESIVLGLSLRQCFFSVFACMMAVLFYFLYIDRLGMEITSWLCMLVAAPFAALGFIHYQGMNAEQIVIAAIQSLILTHRELSFQTKSIYYQILQSVFERHIKEDSVSYDKKLRKIKKAGKRKNKNS